MNASLASAISRKVNKRVAAGQFSGAVLVRKGVEDLFCRAYGLADRTWGVKNTPSTRFRIASVGKMFTAAAVLQLIEAGKLTLDTPAVACLELKGTRIPEEVTIQHLLTMTSGIADWINENAEDFDAEWERLCREHPLYLLRSNADYLPLFAGLEPYSAVGEHFSYSNAGFILLGLMIEKASGQPYFDYIRKNIFRRAGMAHSDFLDLDDVSPNVAEGYVPIRDATRTLIGWRRNIYSTTAGGAGDGGSTCTVDDLARFMRALRAGKIVSKESARAMLSPKVDASSEDAGWAYGYGCFISVGERGEVIRWGHTGEEDGVSCRVDYFPAQKLDVVILGNQSGGAGRVLADIHDVIMGK
jgi:CubicO group peptidase (beta-lactamase class C family)